MPKVFVFFQTAKAQQQIDEDSRQLVEDLSSLLAYATVCRDLPSVNGENIVDRVFALTKEGACLIDESMAYNFFGKSHGFQTPIQLVYLSLKYNKQGAPPLGL